MPVFSGCDSCYLLDGGDASCFAKLWLCKEMCRFVQMMPELVHGCFAACGSLGSTADGVGLGGTEDGFNASCEGDDFKG